ncbi:MAG: AEC family transporter [Betaproteobacteria bacterium]|nr:AEC family transporter [Betaproteobacteria bacterium]
MTAVVFTILPVFAVVLAGYAVARAGLISAEGVTGFTNVTFYLFVPALLFRAMRSVHFDALDLLPLYTYFGGALLCFLISIAASRRWLGSDIRRATVTALAITFSNTVLLGIPLVKLAFGDRGLVILLMIVSLHTLILFATATLFLEFGGVGSDPEVRSHWANVAEAVRNTLVHPVILPIIAGLTWGAMRLPLPDAVDAPLALLAAASGPCSLVLLGASLAQYGIAEYWRPALALSALKIVVFPVVIWALGKYVFGLTGVALAVVTLTAALPVGANVYLFAQRYQVAQGEITAAVALSTAASVVTLALVMLYFG